MKPSFLKCYLKFSSKIESSAHLRHTYIACIVNWPTGVPKFATDVVYILQTMLAFWLNKLNWEKLSKRRQTQKALIMFKTIHKLAPEYLHQLFTPRRAEYNLRNLEGKLALPKPHSNYLKRSFSYSAALLWNNLPQEMRDADSIGNFKRKILNQISDISESHTQSCKTVFRHFFF